MKLNTFKSRKLIGVTVLFLTAVGFLLHGDATFVEWSDFVKWVFTAYVLGNVGEHYTNKINK